MAGLLTYQTVGGIVKMVRRHTRAGEQAKRRRGAGDRRSLTGSDKVGGRYPETDGGKDALSVLELARGKVGRPGRRREAVGTQAVWELEDSGLRRSTSQW